LTWMNLLENYVRLPLTPITERNNDRIKEALQIAGLIQ